MIAVRKTYPPQVTLLAETVMLENHELRNLLGENGTYEVAAIWFTGSGKAWFAGP